MSTTERPGRPSSATIDVDVECARHPRAHLHGYAPSTTPLAEDLGGCRERYRRRAFAGVLDADVAGV